MTGKPTQSATIASEADAGHADDRQTDETTAQTDRLRELIRTSADIPRPVADARFSYVHERLIDKALIRAITGQGEADTADEQQRALNRRRQETLSPYVGKSLVCVMIALPGARYTIEFDALNDRIVHWEWQAG